MISFKPHDEPLFTMVSVYSLLGVVALLAVAHFSGKALLPAKTRKVDQLVFIWLVFDALIHFIFEGAFLYNSMFGKTVFKGVGWSAELWKEYAKADVRWGNADSTVVSLEILTVFIGGPLALYCAYLLTKDSMHRHPWLLILSTGELYGGWMTFCPEWLTGSRNLRTDNFLHLWIYLALMNGLWVIIPFYIMVDSYRAIMKAFKVEKQHMRIAKGK
ncbi:Emopamil-binding protein [Cystobasidium minutum MCA 4210]|uniref:Emopamil-binding protein n=1 Tax=Cystobasidium minutum MCA 4210 TaxID=1397322 RepID=UPI0034CFAD82|eukprot:jgi/Rhomi1/109481/CE109480_2851